jgi:hypothetical protein
MKYLVDKSKFAKFLHSRPAMIKTVVNLTEEFCKDCLNKAKIDGEKNHYFRGNFSEVYASIPPEFRTLAVTREYLKSSTHYGFDPSEIPTEIRAKLSTADRAKILENAHRNIEFLPKPTYDEWLSVLKEGYRNYENVPKEMWTRDTALAVAEKDSGFSNGFKFPKALWTQGLAIDMVQVESNMIHAVPSRLINNEVLRLCLARDLTEIKIPEASWDQATAEEAAEKHAENISIIPPQYITEKVNIIAARHGVSFDALTIKTYPVLVAFVANSTYHGDEVVEVVKQVKDKEQFILDVLDAREDGMYTSIYHIGLSISEDLWIRMIKNHPTCIKHIERINQTPAMVDTFLNTATAVQIDKCAEYINLGKIKAQHAPLLIECVNVLMVEIRNKFFKASALNTVSGNLIEVEMAPSEFAKIKSLVTITKEN